MVFECSLIILFWSWSYLSAFSQIIHTQSLHFPSHRQNGWVIQYLWEDQTIPWWSSPEPAHRYVLICPVGRLSQYTHPKWPHHLPRRLQSVSSSDTPPRFVRTRCIPRFWSQVLRWACTVQTIQSAYPIFGGQFRSRRCWWGRFHHHLNLRLHVCSSWYRLRSICIPFFYYYP